MLSYNKKIGGYMNKREIENIVNEMLQNGTSPSQIINAALTSQETYKWVDAIIKTNDADLIYQAARDIKGASIGKLQAAIIATQNDDLIYKFALKIKGASVEKLAEALSEEKSAFTIFQFAWTVKGAPIEKLENALIKCKDPEKSAYLYFFAEYIEGASVEKLADALIKTGDMIYIRKLAFLVEGELSDKLIQAYCDIKQQKREQIESSNVEDIEYEHV